MSYDKFILYLHQIFINIRNLQALASKRALCKKKIQKTSSDFTFCSWINIDFFTCQQITHPAGCFPQFIKFFGEHIFVLWKFVLLQKRILFFSPPPVGVACYRGNS